MKKKIVRKSISAPADFWADINNFRHKKRIGSEAEAIRRLVYSGLVYEERKK